MEQQMADFMNQQDLGDLEEGLIRDGVPVMATPVTVGVGVAALCYAYGAAMARAYGWYNG